MSNVKYYKALSFQAELLADSRIDFLEEFWGKQADEQRQILKKSLLSYFSKTVEDGTYICFIAKDEDRFAGVGGLVIREQPGSFKNPSGQVGYIMNMYTAPEYRRQGICTEILHLLLKEAKRRGITMFELHATKEGEQVYIKEGFQLHPEPTYRRFISG